MRPRVAQRKVAGRVADRLEQRLREAGRQRNAKRIAISRHVFDRDEARFARDRQRRRSGARARARTLRPRRRAARCAPASSGSVRSPIRISRSCRPSAVLTLYLSSRCWSCRSTWLQRGGIEQLAQLRVAQQLAELRLIDRERLRPPFGQRRVAVVDVVGDVAEEQRRRKRRRRPRIDGRHAQRSRLQRGEACRPAPACRSGRAGFPDRSRAAPGTSRIATPPPAGRRALPLLPQRRRGGLDAGGEGAGRARRFRGIARQRATSTPSCRKDERLDLVGSGSSSAGSGGVSTSGKRTTKPSSPHITSTFMPVRERISRGRRHRPRRVDAAAERREQADAPVAEIVKASLDDDGAVVGDGAGSGLVVEIAQQVLGRRGLSRSWRRTSRSRAAGRGNCAQLPHELADGVAEFYRPSGLVAMPERHLARLTRRRRDEHPIMGDLFDTPGGGAERERLARPASRTPFLHRARRRE